MQIRSVGIDLGKTTFHLVALGASGKVLVKKKFTQKQLLTFTANMQAFVDAIGDDGIGSVLADFELRSCGLFLGRGLLSPDSTYLLRGRVALPSFCCPYAVLICTSLSLVAIVLAMWASTFF